MKSLAKMLLLFLSFASIHVLALSHRYEQGMVVAENKIAAAIGARILRDGGNAIDAAVAVGYALAVVDPCCGNIGGGGFMLIRRYNGDEIVINFREKAPLNANKNMFVDQNGRLLSDASTKGYLAVAVPGTVLGFETALKRFGTLSREKVMAPAIALAKNGYLLSRYQANLLKKNSQAFRDDPNVAAIFLHDNQPYQAGMRLIQTDLANTLTQISKHGTDYFYRGPIANAIVKASKKHGGILTRKDFENYTVTLSKPIHCHYRGLTITSTAPPSSGGTALCEMLNILENFSLEKPYSARDVHLITAAMNHAFMDRNSQLGDPDFVNNPLELLLDKRYAKTISQSIKRFHIPQYRHIEHHELSDTTHYSIVDQAGNAVAVTYTLNGFFGAHVIAPHTGFFLNDEMDDFTIKTGMGNKFGLVQADANAIEPGKRPLSSMTPTIITNHNELLMVLGSPGGPRIITAVLLTLLNLIDYDMPLTMAVNAPRFHYQGVPDILFAEPFAFSFLTTKQLELAGYHLMRQHTWAAVSAILVDPKSAHLVGANDYRRPDGGVCMT